VSVSWGSAIEVPGAAALAVGGDATLNSVSCTSAGDCAAGGLYEDGSGASQAFVASEQDGVWGAAIEVPGAAALNVASYAAVTSVSCASPGNCAAGGEYMDGFGYQTFVVSEQGGVWGTAIEVPGMAGFNVGGFAWLNSVSCSSPGNCSAGGYFSASQDPHGAATDPEPFVVSEQGGVWGTAIQVSFPAAIGYPLGGVNSVSCSGVGDCLAGGSYRNPFSVSHKSQAFVVVERNGKWRNAIKVPGVAALSVGGEAWVESVSCTSPGNCTAGGGYTYGSHGTRIHAFVVAETNGTWRTAKQVPGMAALSGGDALLGSVSCAGAGNCATGGYYTIRGGNPRPFVVGKTNGKWGNAIKVPGISAINHGVAWVAEVSCASPGNCAATGIYTDQSHVRQVFVVAEQSGVWGKAVQVPGTATLGVGADAPSISCGTAGNCGVVGQYRDGAGHVHAFVTAP
jgi:hypothetical protein